MYELEHDGAVSKATRPIKPGCKMARRPDTDLHDATTYLRDNRVVPWSWLVDETRSLDEWEVADTVADFVAGAVDYARIDAWGGEPAPLILCESRSLAGVLRPTAMRYLCPITSTNGQTRGHLVNKVAPKLRPGQPILYFGDLDLAGGDIEEATRRTLAEAVWELLDAGDRRRLTAAGVTPMEWFDRMHPWGRLAITAEQVGQLRVERAAEGLPDPVIRKLDERFGSRDRKGKWFDAVETEALGQARIVGLLVDRLDELMPEPIDNVLERERSQRAHVADRLRDLNAG